jgi:hypothetical protein
VHCLRNSADTPDSLLVEQLWQFDDNGMAISFIA